MTSIEKPEVLDLEKREQELVQAKTGFVIKTEIDYEIAKDRLTVATKIEKEIHDTFDPIVKKAHETHKEATSQRKRHLDPVEAVKTFYQRLIGDYDYQKEQARRAEEKRINDERIREEEERRLEAAKKMEDAGNTRAAELILEQEMDFVPVKLEVEKDTGIQYRDNWQAEIVDETKIPREYLIPDMSKLSARAKEVKGDSNIPGVRFVNYRKAIIK